MKKFKKNQKGFTLVEIIVVLVILAILAAAAIPTMLGFVDEANGKTEVANARAAYVAAQTIATERHAMGDTDAECEAKITTTKVKELAGIDCTSVAANVTDGKVDLVEFVNEDNDILVTITPGDEAKVDEDTSHATLTVHP